jgi:hypothetical protein
MPEPGNLEARQDKAALENMTGFFALEVTNHLAAVIRSVWNANNL